MFYHSFVTPISSILSANQTPISSDEFGIFLSFGIKLHAKKYIARTKPRISSNNNGKNGKERKNGKRKIFFHPMTFLKRTIAKPEFSVFPKYFRYFRCYLMKFVVQSLQSKFLREVLFQLTKLSNSSEEIGVWIASRNDGNGGDE